jgi:hypothetical protein
MYILAIAYAYVILMVAFTEKSVAAGIMTFAMYCVLPLAAIVYLIGAAQRKWSKETAKNLQNLNKFVAEKTEDSEKDKQNISSEN